MRLHNIQVERKRRRKPTVAIEMFVMKMYWASNLIPKAVARRRHGNALSCLGEVAIKHGRFLVKYALIWGIKNWYLTGVGCFTETARVELNCRPQWQPNDSPNHQSGVNAGLFSDRQLMVPAWPVRWLHDDRRRGLCDYDWVITVQVAV
jgi:hypothetical protein